MRARAAGATLVGSVITAVALAGCGGTTVKSSSTTKSSGTTATTAHRYPAAAKKACQQFDQVATTVPQNNYATVTLPDLTPYAQAIQKLTQTAYGPGSAIVLQANKDVLGLTATGALSDQQLAQIDRDAAAVGTFCGHVLSS